MARLSTNLLLTLLLVGLLSEQGFCRPSKEEASDVDEYLNDDYDEDADEEQQYTGPPPSMISTPLEIEVHEGDTVALPCETTNLSELLDVFASVWKKNSEHIFTDGLRREGLDDRIMYFKPNNSLVIHNITKEDAGTFVCLIFFTPALEVKHVVHVFAPAAVKSIEPSSHLQVLKKGAPLNLKCNVTGYPRPSVKWVKKGKHETGEGGFLTAEPNLILNSVDRRDSGVYECIAENDQGPKASASVTVRITYIPEISVEEDLVATGEGYDATLKCLVHAEPKANIEWVYNTDPISPSDRVHFSQQGHTHILEIKKVEPKDFGKYTCRATNSQGSDVSKVIELTGKPNTPHFISAIVGPNGKSLNVELEIISYSPMMEYKLLYKQLDKGNHSWVTVKPPVVDPESSNLFKVKHTLQDLPVGDYVVSFRARNGFGWSTQAKPYAFTIKETSHENHEATAETSKMEESGNGDLNNDSTRPRLMAILTIISLSSFFL